MGFSEDKPIDSRRCGWTDQLWRRNLLAIEEAEASKQSDTGLKRVLRWWELIGYGFAFTVGSGQSPLFSSPLLSSPLLSSPLLSSLFTSNQTRR